MYSMFGSFTGLSCSVDRASGFERGLSEVVTFGWASFPSLYACHASGGVGPGFDS
jgi:hypothetical protein